MNEPKKPTVLAVDGDIVAYKTAAVCEDHWEGACNDIIDSTLKRIATDTGIEKMRIYLSGSNNFRYGVATTKPYKGNRASMTRPQYLSHCKEYLGKEYKAIVVHGYEADDAIATDMTQNTAAHCGIDKDILQISGWHYNYVKEEWQYISKDEAILRLYRQILQGDTSDNIPGLPRIGEAKAAKAITDPDTALSDAMDMYKEVCNMKLPDVDPVEYFLEQTKLVQMVTDIDFLSLITTNVEIDREGFKDEDAGEQAFIGKEIAL